MQGSGKFFSECLQCPIPEKFTGDSPMKNKMAD